MTPHDNAETDIEAERAIVVRLLEDSPETVSRNELYAARRDMDVARLGAAVISLTQAEVVRTDSEGVRSAPALNRLDRLQLVAI